MPPRAHAVSYKRLLDSRVGCARKWTIVTLGEHWIRAICPTAGPCDEIAFREGGWSLGPGKRVLEARAQDTL